MPLRLASQRKRLCEIRMVHLVALAETVPTVFVRFVSTSKLRALDGFLAVSRPVNLRTLVTFDRK